jgi:hypothetical protein
MRTKHHSPAFKFETGKLAEKPDKTRDTLLNNVVFFYDFAVYFDKLYWPAGCHKLMPKRAGVFFYDSQGLLA